MLLSLRLCSSPTNTLHPPTFAAQLRVCRSIAANAPAQIEDGKPLDQRFEPAIWLSLSEAKQGRADHSRFTARFGDILAIAAQSDAESSKINVNALLQYVDVSSAHSGELAAELATLLCAPKTRWRRRSAIRAAHAHGGRGLASEGSLEKSLYKHAQQAASLLLRDIGFSEDWMGLTVLMALARATAGRGSAEWRLLEGAITRHFSGIPHGIGGIALRTASDVGAATSAAASGGTGARRRRVLVVSFASRGVGLARYEFSSTIRALASRGALSDCTVDAMWLADTADAWYTQDGDAKWRGAREVEAALGDATRRADTVIFIGSSMGGTACLRFARFADLVVAFTPQVRLRGDAYVGRHELRSRWRSAALEASVLTRAWAARHVAKRGRSGGTEVLVHRGTGARDTLNTRRLSSRVIDVADWRSSVDAEGGRRDGVTVVQHPGKSHLLAVTLARNGELEAVLSLAISRHMEQYGKQPLNQHTIPGKHQHST